MIQRLEKSRLDIRMSFGYHVDARNLAKLREFARVFRPHVYVSEAGSLLETRRKPLIAERNAMLEKCRADLGKRAIYLNALRYPPTDTSEFQAAEAELQIETPRLWYHIVEGYTQAEADGLNASFMSYRQLGDTLFTLIAQNRLDEALSFVEDAARSIVIQNSLPRHQRALEGFGKMLEELPEMLPRITGAPSIRVIVRYGVAHTELFDLLRDDGYTVEKMLDSPVMGFDMETQHMLIRDPQVRLTTEQRVALLFGEIFQSLVSYGQSEEAFFRREKELYAQLGGAEGFMHVLEGLNQTAVERQLERIFGVRS